MEPYYDHAGVKIFHVDCMELLPTLDTDSVDAIVTDPPYGLSFMGKKWDYDVPGVDVWAACYRVLKPGGHLLCFAGTRTQHRMAVNIEDAGFEVRDMIAWVYGSGFPKSLDVSKAIDKATGAEREVVGESSYNGRRPNPPQSERYQQAGHKAYITTPATDAAKQWDGWGTALKPALEPITVARKPFKGTVANNVLEHGTGGLNIDGCRVGTEDTRNNKPGGAGRTFHGQIEKPRISGSPSGRWPANLIHDGSEDVLGLFPETGKSTGGGMKNLRGGLFQGETMQNITSRCGMGDSGSAARFFYCPKASKADRGNGLDGTRTVKYNIPRMEGVLCQDVSTVLVGLLKRAMSESTATWHIGECGASITGLCPSASLSTTLTVISKITESRILSLLTRSLINESTADANYGGENGGNPAASAGNLNGLKQTTTPESQAALVRGVKHVVSLMLSTISDGENWKPLTNSHATVKPTDLMRYLCRLVTPPGGLVLDPFAGSGSTGKAATLEGFEFIGIEREQEYCEIAAKRIKRDDLLF